MKMNIIKEITKDGYKLTHYWVTDHFGFPRNMFEMFDEKKKIHYPFWGNLRIQNFYRGNMLAGDDISPYTDAEYEDMFLKQKEELLQRIALKH